MQVRIRFKHVAIALAMVMVHSTVAAVPAAAASTSTTPDMQEQYVEAFEPKTYDVTDWWKAELSEYSENLAPVSYEGADIAKTDANDDIGDISTAETTVFDADESASTTTQTTLAAPAETEISQVPVSSGTFVFTTYGYGHGVGLSQNGANYYATYGGYNYQQILTHYYQGTTIKNTGTAETELVTVDGMTGTVMEILPQVVYNEIGCTMNVEAIKAQAVAAYTYMKYYNNNGKDLRRKANPPQNVIDAVESVLGEAVYYKGRFALTSFYASAGGASASCKDIFTQDIPYLRSVTSEYDAACDPHYGTQVVYTAADLKKTLEGCYGIKLSQNPENWIEIVKGDGDYAVYVVIDGQVKVKGNAFRTALGLKSPKITCTYTQ